MFKSDKIKSEQATPAGQGHIFSWDIGQTAGFGKVKTSYPLLLKKPYNKDRISSESSNISILYIVLFFIIYAIKMHRVKFKIFNIPNYGFIETIFTKARL